MMEGVEALKAAGVRCHVVLPAGQEVAPPWRALDIAYTMIPLSWWMSGTRSASFRSYASFLYRLPKAHRAFKRLFEEFQPDLVVTNSLVIPSGAIAARAAKIKHIWFIHEFGDRDHVFHYDLGWSLSLRIIDRLSEKVIVNSKAVEAYFSGAIPADKLRLVYYAVETPNVARAARGGEVFRLVIVGGLSRTKRQDDAIRAVSILAGRGIATRLEIVGPGGPQITQHLKTIARELGVDGAVEFIGEIASPFSRFASADVALMCSRDEAFGRVTVEAMKMGTPVVGADSGGTSGLISDGYNGLLYEPGNPEDLAAKVERLVRDPQLLAAMGSNAHIWAHETFNRQKFATSLLEVFRETLGKDGEARDRIPS
jgi:glycosyltransferase involved in cell wall biosynthesis